MSEVEFSDNSGLLSKLSGKLNLGSYQLNIPSGLQQALIKFY